MSLLFGKVAFVWTIFDDIREEEQEDFFIEEIRCCNCFFDKVLFFIGENNFEINFSELYGKFFYTAKKLRIVDVFMYFSTVTIFCCELILDFYSKLGQIDKDEMDRNCLAEEIDYCCLYYLSRETIFNCICDNCQKTFLKLVSKKLTSIKIKK